MTQQMFVFNGTNATAVGPCTSGGSIIVGALTASSILDLGSLTVDGLSLLNGGFGCVEGSVVAGVLGEDLAWCDSVTHRFNFDNNAGGQDQIVGAATTDTLTNKTFDTAGTGNVLKINGNPVSAATGTGSSSVTGVLNGDPTLLGWNCAITTKTALYTLTGADCIVQASVAGGGFTLTLPHALVGQDWEITRTDATSNTLTIAGDSGNVNNLASITLDPYSSMRCHADGTNAWCHIAPISIPSPNTPLRVEFGTGTGSGTITFSPAFSSAPVVLFTTGGIGTTNYSGSISSTSVTVNSSDGAPYTWFAIGPK